MGGENLDTKTVQAVEAHCGDRSKDAGQHQVEDGAVNDVDEEGCASGQYHGEAQEEFSTQFIHVKYRPHIP